MDRGTVVEIVVGSILAVIVVYFALQSYYYYETIVNNYYYQEFYYYYAQTIKEYYTQKVTINNYISYYYTWLGTLAAIVPKTQKFVGDWVLSMTDATELSLVATEHSDIILLNTTYSYLAIPNIMLILNLFWVKIPVTTLVLLILVSIPTLVIGKLVHSKTVMAFAIVAIILALLLQLHLFGYITLPLL